MTKKLLCASILTLAMWGLSATPALADTTLGTTTQPSGSGTASCSDAYLSWVQTATAAGSPSYVVPSTGQITSWSTNTVGASPGTQVSLVVLAPAGSSYTVLAVDTETLPTPLPVSDVASFNVASPIHVSAGDAIAIAGTNATCFWGGGSIPAGDSTAPYSQPPYNPFPGQTISALGPPSTSTRLDVSAVVSTHFDVGVSTGSSPARLSSGNAALLSSTVTSNGPGSEPVTFVDNVPAGLTIDSALVGNGSCGVSGQTVTCTISSLTAGSSAPVQVVVTPSRPGVYVNHVSVAPPTGFTDATPADNSASATLNVTNAGPTGCVVPKLKGTPSAVAKRVLVILGCEVKVKKKKGHGVTKGSVLKTKPGAGTYPFGTKVTLIVRK